MVDAVLLASARVSEDEDDDEPDDSLRWGRKARYFQVVSGRNRPGFTRYTNQRTIIFF